jgi:Protein phosphatase 2C
VSGAASATSAACVNEAHLMVLSCLSGLWDVLSSQRAVDFARARLRTHNDAAACSRDLVCNVLGRLVGASQQAGTHVHSMRSGAAVVWVR